MLPDDAWTRLSPDCSCDDADVVIIPTLTGHEAAMQYSILVYDRRSIASGVLVFVDTNTKYMADYYNEVKEIAAKKLPFVNPRFKWIVADCFQQTDYKSCGAWACVIASLYLKNLSMSHFDFAKVSVVITNAKHPEEDCTLDAWIFVTNYMAMKPVLCSFDDFAISKDLAITFK